MTTTLTQFLLTVKERNEADRMALECALFVLKKARKLPYKAAADVHPAKGIHRRPKREALIDLRLIRGMIYLYATHLHSD